MKPAARVLPAPARPRTNLIGALFSARQSLPGGEPSDGPQNSLGIVALLLSVAAFALMDAVAKLLIADYPPLLVVWARLFGNLVILLLILRGRTGAALRSRNPLLQLGRAAAQVSSLVLFFYGLRWIGLAEATAIGATGPAIITVLAALILGERLGPRRIIGVAVALTGAMVIIRPGAGVFQPAALLPLMAALTYSFGAIFTRMARADSVQTSLLWSVGIGSVLFTLALPLFWQPIAARDIPLFMALGLLGTIGQALLIRAFSLAEASAVAPFEYSVLLWAGLWGWVMFNTLPDGWTVLGAAIIVAAGLYIWWRETRLARAGRLQPTPAGTGPPHG